MVVMGEMKMLNLLAASICAQPKTVRLTTSYQNTIRLTAGSRGDKVDADQEVINKQVSLAAQTWAV